MSKKTEATGQKGSYLARRKRLARKARTQYPTDRIGWVGGVLYFLETREPVPGVEKVGKDGGQAKGWAAGFTSPGTYQQSKPKEHELGERSSPPRRTWDYDYRW